MKHALLLSLVLAALGCGSSSKRVCTIERSARPVVAVAWRVDHGSIDDDPPRARVRLSLSGPVQEELDLGELFGICKLTEVGALPDEPANGSKVTELACVHEGKGDFATIFFAGPGTLAVKRYERAEGGGALDKVREVKTIEVPACATFSAELAQGGAL